MLADHFDNPPAYLRSLHYLLDYYAERSRTPGRTGPTSPTLTSYKVRIPVLRMILQELSPLALQDPQAGLSLCDALWEEPVLEFRYMAAMLLGQIPVIISDEIVNRLRLWLTTDLDFSMVEYVMEHSLIRLRLDQPMVVLSLIENWLADHETFYRQLGLRALLPLIKMPEFQNVPAFFRLVQPLAQSVPHGLRPDLLDVIASLAQRSPHETAYFLQKTLLLPNSPDTAWLIRQSITQFPADLQKALRLAAKQAEENRTSA